MRASISGLMTKSGKLLNKITTFTGGKADRRRVGFFQRSDNRMFASNDIATNIQANTKLARAMLTQFGMSDEFDMVAMETIQNQYLGGCIPDLDSPETQTKIDSKVVEKNRKRSTYKSTSDFKRKRDEAA